VTKLKVLGIAGSPRQDGNTDLLFREVIAGVASKGIQAKTAILRDLSIAPCRHCDGCIKTGKCVIEDDMQWLHIELRKADRIVLASPIFFMSVTAQTKAMIDRCQALWVLKYILKLPIALNPKQERKGVFVSVGGTKLSNLFQPATVTVKTWFRVLDISYAGELTFSDIDAKGAILNHPTALKEAFDLGRELVSKGTNL